MWFDNLAQIPQIARERDTSIFVVPNTARIDIPQAITLTPTEKSVITIEQIRTVTAKLGLKQTTDQFVIIRPADQLSPSAANAFLKNLEEPGDKIHYLLITDQPSQLLPTILSRAAIYFLKPEVGFSTEITASDADKDLAKKLIAAKPTDLVGIAESLAKKKSARTKTLEVLGLSIEMLYKSYFLTGKEIFIKKLPKFLAAYENINQNGHIKLQIVANLC